MKSKVMKRKVWLAIPLMLLVCGMARAEEGSALPLEQFARQSSDTSEEMMQRLRRAMKKDMQRNGPESAMLICKNVAPVIAQDLSRETGWMVKRVSLHPRNVKLATADEWESRVLHEFEKRAAQGEDPNNIEFGEVVSDAQGKSYRYMRAMWARAVCLDCHGAANYMRDGVLNKLKLEYPDDQSIEYRVGDVVGGVSIRRPL